MAPEGTSSARIVYGGTHERALDEKRRLQIPAKWYQKKDGKTVDIQFALIPCQHAGQPDMCIQVLPPKLFDLQMERVTALNPGDPDGEALRRKMAARLEMVDLDSSGRIVISEKMAKLVGLEPGREAVLAGMLDHFQIWNQERYAATEAGVAARAQVAVPIYT